MRALLPSLAAPLEGVRLAAGQALSAAVARCLDDAAVAGAVSLAGADLLHVIPVSLHKTSCSSCTYDCNPYRPPRPGKPVFPCNWR